jgi:hypothetical protein
MRRCAAAAGLGVIFALAPAPARADKPARPDDRRDTYSPYERATIDAAVVKLGAEVEPRPEGKVIEGIEVVSLDVFEKRDPLPGFLTPIANWFHATTRRYVIEREVLQAPGQRWSQALIDETARNLRGLPQLSLVLCVPLRGSAPGRVRLLVITKDVWSLRLNSNYTYENARLQYLFLQPSEENLVGSHQQVYGNFILDPATITGGAQYVIPRLAGSRVRASASASFIVNRYTGAYEGSTGALSYGQPLYSTQAEWAWGAAIAWNEYIYRLFAGGYLTDYNPGTGQCVGQPNATRDDSSSCRYRIDNIAGAFSVRRSWGSAHKHDLTLGVSATRLQYRAFPWATPALQAAFVAAYMPKSDDVIAPYVEYHDYSSRFVDVLDFETLALTENYRKGHEILLRVTPATTALRSSRNYVELFGAAAYTIPFGDGLVRGIVQGDVEVGTDGTPPADQGRIPDASVEAGLRIVTPRFKVGRLVFDAHVLDRAENYVNALTTLGGDTRLRGYPSAYFIGKNFLGANFEYRSRPFELLSVDFAGVLFFDSGDAFNDWNKLLLKHSVGLGARIEFPQLERVAMRIDWGFPLTFPQGPGVANAGLPAKPWPGDVTITFGQAFSMPTIPTSSVTLPSGITTGN